MKKIETTSGIYCFENIKDNKKYIGQAQNLNRRYKRHLFELRSDKSNNKCLQRAWSKYKEKNFKFYVIEECEIKYLDEKEIYYIKIMKSHITENGYNISWGGTAPMRGVVITEEHRKNLSKSLSGKNNPMYGKKLSKITLMKISKALTGRVIPEESRLKSAYGQVGTKKVNKTSSKYIGVNKHKDGGFVARIADIHEGKRLYLGYFKKEKDAAVAYDKKSWELYLDLSKLNFPKRYGENNGS